MEIAEDNSSAAQQGMRFYAHTRADAPSSTWQPLEDHLLGVSRRAAEFASKFGASSWGALAGLWHDLGKYSHEFQAYLKSAGADSHQAEVISGRRGKIDHSSAGSQHAVARFGLPGYLLAFVIAGHHSGLHDAISGQRASLDTRLKKDVLDWSSAPSSIVDRARPEFPDQVAQSIRQCSEDGLAAALWVRMLFSCLIDADRLDTEAFSTPHDALLRSPWPSNVLALLRRALDDYVAQFPQTRNVVSEARSQVRSDCLRAAEKAPGLFSLTVPTGGGKTLASLAFALAHARKHGLDRVIYVVPFTSIIEQTAAEFRRVFAGCSEWAESPIIEHHSSFDSGEETTWSRLATENWDAPIVVTTSVQFYESLFSAKTSRCRKLHNIARSVVILDEVQTLPVELLAPCLHLLHSLATSYGTTVVLCTATQPAVQERENFPIGLRDVREISSDPRGLFEALVRVRVEQVGSLDDNALATQLESEPQVLCIVNTRDHARELYKCLGEAGEHRHLSALMCPAHRRAELVHIRQRLREGRACRLVSTQLIEAGVDIDFPCVFRAVAGLDSIAQAAGRCNREGRLNELGRVYVFRPDGRPQPRFLSNAVGCAAQVLVEGADPLGLAEIESFFELYYWRREDQWDARNIADDFAFDRNPRVVMPFLFSFRAASEKFKLIESTQKPVIIPWGLEGERFVDQLRRDGDMPNRRLLRDAQQFTVQVHEAAWSRAQSRGVIELLHDRYAVLLNCDTYYDEKLGLDLDGFEVNTLEI